VLNKDMVVVERLTRITVEARGFAIPFRHVEPKKYTEPLKTEQFLNNGFVKRSRIPSKVGKATNSRSSKFRSVARQVQKQTQANAEPHTPIK